MTNLISVGYVPPSTKSNLNPIAFVENISAWKCKYPVLLYSDHNYDGFNKIANPEQVKHPRFPFAVNNAVFLFGLKLAIDSKADYMLYLESDVRVRGHGWDEIIFDDFFRDGKEPILYGTNVSFNISQGGGEVVKRFIDLNHRFIKATGCPPAVHGAWPGSPEHPILFPNGALTIAKVSFLQEVFGGFEKDIGRSALSHAAFDHEIGVKFWRKYGIEMFDHFQFSTKCYSGYGDTLMDYGQRKEKLLSGQMNAIHQCKTSETFIT
jgi:hypothetical protein